MKEITTLIFDVNETLLDLSPLKDKIDAELGKGSSDVWFAELLQYSLVESITGSYHNFSEIAEAILHMNAQKKNLRLSKEKTKKILGHIKKLKAYPEVEDGLKSLKNAGFKLIAFSNGKPDVLSKQLEYAGLTNYFDLVLSVDEVEKYKPHPGSYSYALGKAGSTAGESIMVAAHDWDIAGANRAGLQTAFIQRPGKFLFPLASKPTWELPDISELAKTLTD